MKYLFIDTETTGLPINGAAPYTDLDNWPQLLSVGMVVANEHGHVIGGRYMVRGMNGAVNNAEHINGLTDKVRQRGYGIRPILTDIIKQCWNVDMVIAHNVEFDRGVIYSEIHRINWYVHQIENEVQWFCTKEDIPDLTGEPASIDQRKYRPNVEHRLLSLNDLHSVLFGIPARQPGEIHNALTDAQAVCKCFFELKKQGLINV